MESQNKVVSVELADGTVVKVEATLISDRKIGLETRPFSEATLAIKSLAQEIAETVQTIKPNKAKVRFGIEIGVDAGKLTAVLAKGVSTANIEITLEWDS
ncbi:CU044_2847 family protein [Calothrix sp. UHCC 0171]|uniref:CU044_2847 family protein n=1 Tax=Calothrix sp. UHCC 0171 TaxID=3110245 RepID=UPI002B1F90F4|nr:CU044_2847 family protein [Calothrix sp. UHCC 0171]MEA5570291.1 CU044_2847 family protein [Calothrix sp. UHCC 0171]